MEARQRWTMVAATLGSSIVFLDGTVVNIALPKIGQELPAYNLGVLEGQTYVNTGYLAVLAALLILGGALNDRYGRKRVFGIGLVGFGITSVLCGLAPSLDALVLFRLLQGAAAALLVPGSLALITSTFAGPELARAFGIWAAATSAATLLGPVVGGILVQDLTWRLAFLLNVPLIAIALFGLMRGVPETKLQGASGRFDWIGSIDVILIVGGLSFGLIRGQQNAWTDPVGWGAIVVGLLALAAFPWLMSRRPDPLVPLSLFKSRRFTVINIATFVIYGGLYVFLANQAIFLQGTLGYTAVAASLVGLPVGIMLTLLSARIGTYAGRLGPRRFLVAGPFLMAGALLWYARVPATSAAWRADLAAPATFVPPASTLIDILPAILVFGLGISCVVAPLTSTLMSSVPVARAGLGSAINNSISRVGYPLIGAIVFIAITTVFYNQLGASVAGLDTNDPAVRAAISPLNAAPSGSSPELVEAIRSASADAFRLALIVCAGLVAIGGVVDFVGLRGSGQPSQDDPEQATIAARTDSVPGSLGG
ncbi:MAG TPA: MFS transporter [Patescibacteria group bacterium]|nr:MFS transporter [Patescibacteria group bacterium]